MNNFYEYWVNFESWRDFSLQGEHDVEDAHDRYEKRWMIKENDRKSKVCVPWTCGRIYWLECVPINIDVFIVCDEVSMPSWALLVFGTR